MLSWTRRPDLARCIQLLMGSGMTLLTKHGCGLLNRVSQILVSKPELRSSIYSWINHLEWTILPNYERAIIELENHPTLKAWGDRYKKVIDFWLFSLPILLSPCAVHLLSVLPFQVGNERFLRQSHFSVPSQCFKILQTPHTGRDNILCPMMTALSPWSLCLSHHQAAKEAWPALQDFPLVEQVPPFCRPPLMIV